MLVGTVVSPTAFAKRPTCTCSASDLTPGHRLFGSATSRTRAADATPADRDQETPIVREQATHRGSALTYFECVDRPELESAKSRRTIALPPQLVAALKAHRAVQLQERMTAGPAWQEGDFVWCQPNGRPTGAHADWDEWNDLLKAATIRRVRVHDARHAAATLLLAQGVDQRVVMETLGHSQISMTSRSAHVLPQVMTDAAERIGQAL